MYQFSIICTRTTFVLDSLRRLDGWIREACIEGEVEEAAAYKTVQYFGRPCQ